MKIKSILFIIMCLVLLFIPSTVFAVNKVKDYTDFNGNEYELFDDNTARITKIAKGNEENHGTTSSIHGEVLVNEEEVYKVTSISADALDYITEKQDLYVYPTIAPKLETTNSGDFFKNINAIYVPLAVSYAPEFNAQGYTEANGWPKAKLKNYVITEQPKALTEVTAGEITTSNKLSVRFTSPVAGGSLVYEWYFCDKDGNIIDKENSISNEPDLQIPKDLTYDHESNTSKDYYFRCLVGDPVNIREYSNIAKVTVKPGTYKISFNYSNFLDEIPEAVTISVNNERKLNSTDMSKVPTEAKLEKYREGAIFIGWTADEGKTIYSSDDLAEMAFDKNMELYPVWKTKINIDANGGKFADGSTMFSTYISNFGDLDKELPEPKLEGDEALGLSYGRISGNMYEGEMLTEETTLYVQWKNYRPTSGQGNADPQPQPNLGEKDDTPKTGSDMLIGRNIIVLLAVIVSAIGLIKLRRND